MEQSKPCNQCLQLKPLSAYYRRGKDSDKYMAVCKDCKDAYALKYAIKNKKPKASKPLISCLTCNQLFSPYRDRDKTCSKLCAYTYQNSKHKRNNLNTGFCWQCNKSLLGKRVNARYCSRTCLSKEHNFKYRGCEAKRVTTARRRLIIERDNQTCYLCNQFVEYKKIDIDHLVPKTRGGSSAAHNLSVTCQTCNRGRGNRIGIEQLVRLFELRPSE